MPLITTTGGGSVRGLGRGRGVEAVSPVFSSNDFTPPQSNNPESSSDRHWVTYGFQNYGPAFTLTGFEVYAAGHPDYFNVSSGIIAKGGFNVRVLVGPNPSTLTVSQLISNVNSGGTNIQYLDLRDQLNVPISNSEILILQFISSPVSVKNLGHYVASAAEPQREQTLTSDVGGLTVRHRTNLTVVNFSGAVDSTDPIDYANSNLPSNQRNNGSQWKFFLYANS